MSRTVPRPSVGSSRKDDADERVTSRFCNHFSIVSNRLTYKTSINHPGVKVVRTCWS